MSAFDSSMHDRAVDPASSRVTCISAGLAGFPTTDSGRHPTAQYAFDAFAKPALQIADGRYTLPYEGRPSRREDPGHSQTEPLDHHRWFARSVVPAQIRTTFVADEPVVQRLLCGPLVSPEKLRGLTVEEADQAYNLFVRVRRLVGCTDQVSTLIRGRLRDALLIHKVMDNAIRRRCQTAMNIYHLQESVRDDLFQEATLILQSRLTSPDFHFCDQGLVRFVAWLDTVAERACLEASRCPRVEQPPKIALVDPDRMARVAAAPQKNEVDEKDFSDRQAAVINAIPDPNMREVIYDIGKERTIIETADRLGVTSSKVVRLREKGAEEVRRIWPAGRAGL